MTTSSTSKRGPWWLAALLALAGCMEDDDPPPPPTAVAPTITAQPAAVTVTQGQTANFTVAASGTDITYQWRRGGADLVGATAASYTSAATVITDSGAAYSVRLCSGAQSTNVCVDSSSATLSVTPIALSALPLAGAAGQSGSTDGTGASARFSTANYLAVSAAGTVYVGDFGNSTVRAVTPAGVVSTLVGTAGATGYADGMGAAARFRGNGGLAVDSAGTLYVADWDNFVIRRVSPAGVVSTWAGTAGARGSADGTGAAARFGNPNGMAVDAAGNLFVADWGNHTIRRISVAGEVSTLAGTAGAGGNADGTAAAARFNLPTGVAVDGAGNVYVSIRATTPSDASRRPAW